MTQFARPDSTIAAATFNGGFAAMDETTPSDADFAWATPGGASSLEVGLSNVTDPAVGTGHVIRYRVAKVNSSGVVDGGGNAALITVSLRQGATTIATDAQRTATGTWTEYTLTLTGTQADSITDYTDLRLFFDCPNSGGNPSARRGQAISYAVLEVPDASAGQNFSQGVSGALSFVGTLARRASRSLAGSLGFSGSVAKRANRSTSGAVTFTATTVKRTGRSTTSAITFSTSFTAELQVEGTPALVIIHFHTE